MSSLGAEPHAVEQELKLLLESAIFTRNERLSRFLQFVVEQHLAGRGHELKESVIGAEIFGRKLDYDPKKDAIVRTEARRLRALLNEYYLGNGKNDPLVIELPKGGYTPVFHPQVGLGHAPGPAPIRRTAPRRLWLTVAALSVACAVAAVTWWQIRRTHESIPIAVLPLNNLSQDPDSDYFADGLTDEIIRSLSIIDGLAVRSQTSSFAFKGRPRNVREAGQQLKADYILEGSVLRAGQQLRINAQLVRARDDFPVWSGRFDRQLTDIFAIQDEISLGIVNSLRLKLGRGRRRYETSAEAYDSYLRGRALPLQHGLRGYDQSIGPLEKAIAKDPSFAPAYAGLAEAHAFRSGQFRFDIPGEASKTQAAAEKAIQLDPLLAEAHEALAMAYSRSAQWDQAERSFRRAIELDPSRSMSHDHYAFFLLWPLGRIEEALQQMRVAEKVDPLSHEIERDLAYALIPVGRYNEAAELCERLPADYPGRSLRLAQARLGQGRIGEAIQLLQAEFNPSLLAGSEVRGYLGYAYARAGRREEAEKLAADPQNPFNQAIIFGGLADKDRAFEALDRAAPAGPFRMGRALTLPELVLLRGDPRLKVLRKKVGLPE
jgi:TolB-like protein/Flp pilus assembly protein TadD